MVYVRSEDVVLNELSKAAGAFDKQDSIGEFEERELRNRNPKFGRFNRPNLFYPIYANPNMVDECGYVLFHWKEVQIFLLRFSH